MAFETDADGDRQRSYVLSYELLVKRRFSVTLFEEIVCGNYLILRNEATAELDDLAARDLASVGNASRSHGDAPGARWPEQLSPSHPPSDATQGENRALSQRLEPTAAPAELRNPENESPAALETRDESVSAM
jgi:hypothetical protein